MLLLEHSSHFWGPLWEKFWCVFSANMKSCDNCLEGWFCVGVQHGRLQSPNTVEFIVLEYVQINETHGLVSAGAL